MNKVQQPVSPVKVEIDEDRYNELLEAEGFLSALEAAGVDNWDGYDFACDAFHRGEF